MPKTKISEYSATNSANTDIEGINIDEGCAPSGINNAIRELMVHLKEFQTGASGDAFTFAGGTLMSGTNTISGAAIISGNINSSGTNTFSGSNFMSFSGGSSASPSIYFASDTNTGIFSPAADTIAFTEGGAEAMRIDSSGNVGIGNTTPRGRLSVGADLNNGATDASTGINLKQTSTTAATGIYIERSGERKGYYIYLGSGNDGLGFQRNNAGTKSDVMTLDRDGNVLIGTTSAIGANAERVAIEHTYPVSGMSINQTTGNTTYAIEFRNQDNLVGSVHCSTTATAFNTSSDYRLKENIAPMTGALATVSALKPCTYTWKADGSVGQGFIAHELQAVVPDAVTGEKDATDIRQVEVSPAVPATYDDEGNELTPAIEAIYEEREVPKYQGVDTSFLVATLTAAIQELKAINDAQATRIETLEAQNAAFEARLAALEAK